MLSVSWQSSAGCTTQIPRGKRCRQPRSRVGCGSGDFNTSPAYRAAAATGHWTQRISVTARYPSSCARCDSGDDQARRCRCRAVSRPAPGCARSKVLTPQRVRSGKHRQEPRRTAGAGLSGAAWRPIRRRSQPSSWNCSSLQSIDRATDLPAGANWSACKTISDSFDHMRRKTAPRVTWNGRSSGVVRLSLRGGGAGGLAGQRLRDQRRTLAYRRRCRTRHAGKKIRRLMHPNDVVGFLTGVDCPDDGEGEKGARPV